MLLTMYRRFVCAADLRRSVELNDDPVVQRIEIAARLDSPQHASKSTPAALSFRVAAQLMAITVNDKRSWDVRNEFEDTSGYGGPMRFVNKFPAAAQRAQERRLDDLLGIRSTGTGTLSETTGHWRC